MDVPLSWKKQDGKELRADRAHLRKWRKSIEQARGLTIKVVLTMIVTGFCGAVWLGIKTVLGKYSQASLRT